MSKDKLTDYSATNASNTDVGGVNIDEGMLPSAVNNALRELLTHLKEFSDGTSGIDVLSLADDDASAAMKLQAPASVTSDTTLTLPDGDGDSGQTLVTNGSGTLAWAAPYGNRNLIINSAMQVAQRGTSVTGLTSSSTYQTIDRYKVEISACGTFTVAQSSEAPNGFANSFQINCTTADASLDAGSLFIFSQRLEGQDLQRFKKGTSAAESMTVSFYIKAHQTGSFVLELVDDDNGPRQICSLVTINSADTWEYKTVTFAGDTTGAFGDDTGSSLAVNFWFVAGTTFSSGTLSTSWAARVDGNRAAGTDNFADTTGSIYITGVQLEVGETATPFEHRSFGDELARCQRYFQVAQTKVGLAGTTNGSTEVIYVGVPLNVPLRSAPTLSGPTSWAGRNASVASSSSNTPTTRMDNANSCMLSIDQTGHSGFSDNRFACLHFSGGDLKMDSEL